MTTFFVLPECIEKLRKYYKNYDVSELRHLSHSIKGEVSYYGAPEINNAVVFFHDTLKSEPENKEKL